ncbi:MAG: murein L,D-transpeptidase family protein, partial [Myxococcales bacterium]
MRRSRTFLTLGCVLLAAIVWTNVHEDPLPQGVRADRVVVEKGRRELVLLQGDTVLKRYRVSLGAAPVGHKEREGDGRTPEGRYVLDGRLARSGYHRALHVSYPDAADRARAAARGVPPGGQIMIHGLPNGLGLVGRAHRLLDWTAGCVALT